MVDFLFGFLIYLLFYLQKTLQQILKSLKLFCDFLKRRSLKSLDIKEEVTKNVYCKNSLFRYNKSKTFNWGIEFCFPKKKVKL